MIYSCSTANSNQSAWNKIVKVNRWTTEFTIDAFNFYSNELQRLVHTVRRRENFERSGRIEHDPIPSISKHLKSTLTDALLHRLALTRPASPTRCHLVDPNICAVAKTFRQTRAGAAYVLSIIGTHAQLYINLCNRGRAGCPSLSIIDLDLYVWELRSVVGNQSCTKLNVIPNTYMHAKMQARS